MRAAVIPTRDRAGDFADCVAAIQPQVDLVVAVAHGADAYEYAAHTSGVDVVVLYPETVPNISEMWALGIDTALDAGAGRWVAVLNDDAIVSPEWFDTLVRRARHLHAAGASGWRSARSRKIAGFAFILDLTSGVRPDERFRWWYSDDAIQRRCEAHSWFALVEDAKVEHRHPNLSTVGLLRRISREDCSVFEKAYPTLTRSSL